jgi:hypothetical protein
MALTRLGWVSLEGVTAYSSTGSNNTGQRHPSCCWVGIGEHWLLLPGATDTHATTALNLGER